jgi:hypothetical protein
LRSLSLLFPGFIFFFFSTTAHSQDSLVIRKFFNEKVELRVPDGFKALSATELRVQFPNTPDSVVILTNPENAVTIKIIPGNELLTENQVEEYAESITKELKNDPKTVWLGNGVNQVHGKNIGFFKLIYAGKNMFAYNFFASFNGKLLMFVINSPVNLVTTWEDKAEEIASTLIFY